MLVAVVQSLLNTRFAFRAVIRSLDKSDGGRGDLVLGREMDYFYNLLITKPLQLYLFLVDTKLGY